MALCVCAAFVAIYVSQLLPAADRNVVEPYVTADYLAAVAGALVLETLIFLIPMRSEDKGPALVLWALKARITLLFIPIYEAHYATLDARQYFTAGTSFGAGRIPAFGHGTDVVHYAVYLATRLLPSYFHLLEVVWSFIGLLAIVLFYKGFRLIFVNTTPRLLLIIGLFPGILFWSSILGKDPLVLFGIGLYFYGVAHWCTTRRLAMLSIAALGVAIATTIRPWLAVILVAPTVAFALTGRLHVWQKTVFMAGVAIAAYFASALFFSRFQIANVHNLVQTSNSMGHGWARGGSAVQLPTFGGIGGMFLYLPLGMFTALFRPLPGEVNNAFGLISGMANLFLAVFLMLALRRRQWWTFQRAPVLWMALLILLWSALYAVPSSQNLGTAVRYRLQILPILWPLLWLLSRQIVPRGFNH
jgi:hypothetical protein